jgi:WD40 repeat protein
MSENEVAAKRAIDLPPPEREKGIVGAARAAVDKGRAFLLGYDLFISYRRADANDYALRLADRLTKIGFRCYLDQFSSSADANLPEDVKYALRNSAGLVVVGSPGALESKAIAEEVSIFSKLSRTILPISAADTLNDDTWSGLIKGISRTDETQEALEKGRPSRQVLTRLSDSARFRRRNAQLKRTFLATLAGIALIIVAGLGSTVVLGRQAAAARSQAQGAVKSKDKALEDEKAAEDKRDAAISRLSEIQAELGRKETELDQANTDRDKAQEGAKRAQEQERTAKARAEEQTRIAEEQHRVAVSQELAAGATQQLPTNPEASVLLARDAYMASPTVEAKNILRRSLLTSHVRSVITDGEGLVRGIVFDREGQYVATANDAGEVKVWSAETGTRLAVLTTGEPPENGGGSSQSKVSKLEFSPDGKYIAYGASHDTTYLWKWQDDSSRKGPFTLRWVEGMPSGVACLARSGCVIRTIAFSPDSRYIAAADERGVIWVWETASGNRCKFLSGHSDWVNEIKFSPSDGKYIASAGNDEQTLLWDWQSPIGENNPRKIPGVFTTPPSEQYIGNVFRSYRYPVNGVSFSDKGQYMVTSANCSSSSTKICSDKYLATVYSVEDGKPLAVLSGHESRIEQASFSPDGDYVVTASLDGTARVWNWRDSRLLSTPVILRGHAGNVSSVAFSPDGRLIVTGGWDGTVRLWQSGMGLEDGHESATLSSFTTLQGYTRGAFVDRVAFSPDGKFIMTTGNDGTARLWGVGLERGTAALKEINREELNAAFSPDARHVVTGGSSGSSLKVWELDADGNLVGSKELSGQSDMFLSHASFSPDGRYIIAAGNNFKSVGSQAIQIWDWRADDGSEKEPWIPLAWEYLSHVAFSHDAQGRYVLAAGRARGDGSNPNVMHIWDRISPRKIPDVGPFESSVVSAAFSFDADSRYVAVAGGASVHVCDWRKGGMSACVDLSRPQSSDSYRGVAFSPDGKYVAAASVYGIVNVWEWQTQEGRQHPLVMLNDDLHRGLLFSVSFNPDSTLLITNGQDSIARLWDIRTGSLVLRLGGEIRLRRESVFHLLGALASFSSDGKKIIATDSAGVRIYDCRECVAEPAALLSLIGEHVSPQAQMAGPSRLLQELQPRKKRAGKAGGSRR